MKTDFRFLVLMLLVAGCGMISPEVRGGERVRLDQSMILNVPDDYQTVDNPKVVWFGQKSDDASVYAVINTVNMSDFDESKVFAHLDTMLFNLSAFEQVDTKQESWHDLSRNYMIKKYVGKEDTTKHLATYTFYSFTRPYAMLVNYGKEENYKEVESLGDGLSKAEVGGWRQLLVFWKFSKGVLCAIFLISIFLPPLLKKLLGQGVAVVLTILIAWGLIFYCMWGFPVALVISLVVTLLTSVIASCYSLSEILD